MTRSGKTLSRAVAATALIALTGMVTGACASTPSTDSTDQTTANQTAPPTSESAPADTETTEPKTAAEVVAEAVDSLAEAGTYAFEAKILLSVQGGLTEAELEGWVDGSDRELVMKIDQQEVTTRVIDGVATVQRGEETVEVPLSEAGSAPSILILKSIQDATFATDGTITGQLDASDLASADYEVTGSAAITVTVTSNGTLAGYSMVAEDESWSVDVRFTDVGESPNR